MKNEDRIKYYMGDLYDSKIITSNNSDSILEISKLNSLSYEDYIKCDIKFEHYTKQFFNFVRMINKNKKLDLYIGDNSLKNYLNENINNCFIKNRIIGLNKQTILLKCLNEDRHWSLIKNVHLYDINFDLKNNSCIWRGVATGIHRIDDIPNRKKLVSTYYNNNNFDIGYTNLLYYKDKLDEKFLKRKMSLKEQLKSKFIISVEGNDVASGLKWQLLSNSVVMMPKPRCSSWLMEDNLIPDYHYILIKDDFSDLQEKFDWAKNNISKCKEISKNATEYMQQFLDKQNEDKIQIELIRRYFDKLV